MSEEEKKKKSSGESGLGPSVLLGLVGAVVVLLLLAGGIWGVSKIISSVRDNGDESQEDEEKADGDSEDEEVADGEGEDSEDGDGEATDEDADTESEETEQDGTDETTEEETSEETTDEVADEQSSEEGNEEEDTSNEDESQTQAQSDEGLVWKAIDYKSGDIKGDTYTVVWGDTLWEIAEGRYGSGYDWVKIRDANSDKVSKLPNGRWALILPGQVLDLPE